MNETTFTERIRRLEPCMFRMGMSLLWQEDDVADAMQEAILKAWAKLPSLKNPAYFDTWLIRILINECRNIQRKNKHRPLPLEEATAVASPVPDPQLRDALRSMPEQLRLPLVMHHVEGIGLPDVSKALKIPVTTVKSRLFRARKMLKELLNEEVE